MTQIIIKKRRTLSLSKQPAPEPEVIKPTREELDAMEAAIKKQRYQDCKNWIYSNWPDLFDPNNVKPLSLGIDRMISAKHKEAGGFEVLGFGSVLPVKRFVGYWVNRKAYQRALAEPGAQRFNLLGEAVSLVREEDQAHALQRLEKIKARSKANKRGEKKDSNPLGDTVEDNEK